MHDPPNQRPSNDFHHASGAQPTEEFDGTSLWAGRTLGDRYRVDRILGRGGMGEVWQAFDLKLCVEVALKALRPAAANPLLHDLLRREVRAAREVMSPNVCRIFDLIEADGQELLSMEYVDGSNIAEFLRQQGSPGLGKSIEIASQLLAGLQAIHDAGLVHRDLKPENVMITRSGRIVVMDFGIAKVVAEGGRGTIAGTPAYMAPEQLRGGPVDARTDVYAAGMVLAELIHREAPDATDRLDLLRRGIRQDPPQLPDGPWHDALLRALAPIPEKRWPSARAFARALEDMTLRIGGVDDRNPFPGLSSFTQANAEFFFGREADVETIGKKLRRLHMLAVVGPSGIGKSSFLRAGLIPSLSTGWASVICAPGPSPFISLGQALIPQLAGDTEAMQAFLRFGEVDVAVSMLTRWRQRHDEALLIIDQFEELFTQTPKEVQDRFAEFLGRLPIEADVKVLLSMRDDFLFHCHAHPGLRPILTELTLLSPLRGPDLRRVLVQPALACGFRFEEDTLVDRMVVDVESERGALPLLAFTAARLWELRDRERGVIPSEAYERIGGVAGSLAQHAEATLERIGSDRQDLVREIFRNLITSQGTRVSRERGELLSVFEDRTIADEVLSGLIDARLLTSYEAVDPNDVSARRQRVEIVHESLLSNWPRLVRWQTQDADGAQLRDQIRQAAQLWEERGRSEDMLWTGTVYQEFQLWRERYPGGLTEAEERFATAMTDRAERARRRRRRIVTGTIAALVVVASTLTTLWIRAGIAQRRSEANTLLAQGRNEMQADPTYALAYALASVEKFDTPAGRRLVLEALSQNPAALMMDLGSPWLPNFDPGGKRLAVTTQVGAKVFSPAGSSPIDLEEGSFAPMLAPDGDRVVLRKVDDRDLVRIWSLSEGREVRAFRIPGLRWAFVRGGQLWLLVLVDKPGKESTAELWSWEFDDREPRLICSRSWDLRFDIDPTGQWLVHAKGRGVYVRPIERPEPGGDRLVGELPGDAHWVGFDQTAARIAAADSTGDIRIWPFAGGSLTPLRILPGKGALAADPCFDSAGRFLAVLYTSGEMNTHLWDLTGPAGADPFVLKRALRANGGMTFDPIRPWLVTSGASNLSFWPLIRPLPYVLHGPGIYGCVSVAFTPDGRSLVCGFDGGGVRIWDLNGGPARDLPVTLSFSGGMNSFHRTAMDPLGRFILVCGASPGGPLLVSLTDGTTRALPDDPPERTFRMVAISPDGTLAAGIGNGGDGRIPVWDLESGTVRYLDGPKGATLHVISFSRDGRLLSSDRQGHVRRWNLQDGGNEEIVKLPGQGGVVRESRDGRYLLAAYGADTTVPSVDVARTELILLDLKSRASRPITTHGSRVSDAAFDPAESLLVTVDIDGMTRVGPITGGEPHLLFRQMGEYGSDVAVSPDGRWIATGDFRTPTVRLQRMPTGRPFHTLPRDEFLERVRSLACYRVIADPNAATGYAVARAPFTAWEKVPTW